MMIIALLPLAGCKHGGSSEVKADEPERAPVAVEVATVEARPVDITVSAQGTLMPGQGASARVAAVVAGRLVEVRVREGDRVTAGQIVAILDNRPQQAGARSAAAALTASQAQARQTEIAARAAATDQTNAVHLARLTLEAARLDRDNAIRQAQTALLAAETDLRKTKAGARPQEIAQAEQTVVQARATRDRAATELERVQFLYEKGIAARRQWEDAKTALSVGEAVLESARQQASLVRAGARAEDVKAAELRVQQAREAQAQAKTSGDAKVAQAQAVLRQAEQSDLQVAAKRQEAQAMRETANQKRADLAAAQATAGYAELRAPLNGIVTRRALNPGDMADPATPVLEITDTRALNLLANLPAEDGLKVRAGMSVRVTVPDTPGTVLGGRVLNVGQVDPQTNLMTVRIAVAQQVDGSSLMVDGRSRRNHQPSTIHYQPLRAGSFATADIVLRTEPRAVVVPKQAVVTREEKTVVFVTGPDNVAHLKEVEVGAEQEGLVEIRKGLAAGTRVIRLGQYALTDGAKVQPKKDAAKDDKP